MAITGTYKQKTSPKIWKFFQFGADSGLPPPFSYTSEFGKRSSISEYRREIKNFSSNLTIGGMNITTLDSGSIFATHLNGSHFTGQQISIYAQSPVQEGYMKIFNGFVGDTQYSKGIIQFSVIDKYYNIKDAKLEFNYKPISHSAFNEMWGTVTNISGSLVYFRIPNETYYTYYILTSTRKDDPRYYNYSYTGDDHVGQGKRLPHKHQKVRMIYRNLGDYDNFITESNYVKFAPPEEEYNGNYGDNPKFDEIRSYKVSGQLNDKDDDDNQLTWTNSNGHVFDVKEGTLELEGNVRGVRRGYKIYLRQPLYIMGNPIHIIGSLARGDNNSLAEVMGTIPIDEDNYATMSAYCGNMFAFKEYVDSSKGDVAGIITQLAEESFFDVWIDKNGTMRFSAIKPYGNSIDTQGSFYNDQNAWGFKYSDNMDDVAYRVDAKYGIKSYPDYTVYDNITRKVESSKNKYFDRAIILDKDFEFYHDEDEVVTFIGRELFWRRNGVVRWEWESPLFGLDMELGSYTVVRNEMFPTGSRIIYCDSIGINLNENLIKFGGWDYTNCFLNTYILTWQGNAIANPTTVTATSNSGWVRLDPEVTGSLQMGTMKAIAASGSIATLVLWHDLFVYDKYLIENLVATTGWHFKLKTEIGSWQDGANKWWGTFTYRYQRLWGNSALSAYSGAASFICFMGTQTLMIRDLSLPINQLKNSDGDFIGGTTQNLTSPYGTSSIFW